MTLSWQVPYDIKSLISHIDCYVSPRYLSTQLNSQNRYLIQEVSIKTWNWIDLSTHQGYLWFHLVALCGVCKRFVSDFWLSYNALFSSQARAFFCFYDSYSPHLSVLKSVTSYLFGFSQSPNCIAFVQKLVTGRSNSKQQYLWSTGLKR